jgi:uncharacterized membrane protein (UPF0127 family)
MILLSIIALITIIFSALVVVFYPTTGKSFVCPTNSSVTYQSSQNVNLLSGFPVGCIQILNTINNSTTSAGLVYIAGTAPLQIQGFQNATSFGNCNGYASDNAVCEGMIFVFPSSQEACFWMHNTIIPLQQVWISQNGTIVYSYLAKPENDSTICYFSKYVLETFPAMSISVGDIVIVNTNQT